MTEVIWKGSPKEQVDPVPDELVVEMIGYLYRDYDDEGDSEEFRKMFELNRNVVFYRRLRRMHQMVDDLEHQLVTRGNKEC